MTTRRRLLSLAAAAGVASMAGCSLSADDDGSEYDADAVADVPDTEVPSVSPTLPAGVAADHVEASLVRARELLDRVPESVSSSEVPNEVVRTRIERRRNDAVEYLESVTGAEASLEGLSRVRGTRADAAEAETMYAVATRDRTLDDVLDRTIRVGDDLRTVESEYGYEGADPVETLVTAGTAEKYLAIAERILSSPGARRHDSEVMSAAEAGGRIEKAAAYVEDARHVHERFATSQDDPGDFEANFEAALGSLLADLTERCSAYDQEDRATPSSLVDASIEDTPAEEVLESQLFRVRSDCNHLEEGNDGRLARRLLRAHGAYHDVLALSEARQRIEDGQFRMPADAAVLDDRRARALDAIESAASAAEHPRLARRRLEDAASHVRRGDETRTRRGSPVGVEEAVQSYDIAVVMATTTTDADEWLVDGLEAAAERRRERF